MSAHLFNPEALEQLKDLEGSKGRPLIEELIELYSKDTPVGIKNILDFYQKNDLDSVEKVAHALKSSSASLGLESLSAILKDIEKLAQEKNSAALQPHILNLNSHYKASLSALIKATSTKLTGEGP